MDLGLPEIVVILVIVLVLFGPSKLPKMGESLGKAIRGFRDAMSDHGGEPEHPAAGQREPGGPPRAPPR